MVVLSNLIRDTVCMLKIAGDFLVIIQFWFRLIYVNEFGSICHSLNYFIVVIQKVFIQKDMVCVREE